MKNYLTAHSVRTEKGQSYWSRIGVAFENEKGGFTVLLNALPAAENGQVKIVLQPPKAPVETAPQAQA